MDTNFDTLESGITTSGAQARTALLDDVFQSPIIPTVRGDGGSGDTLPPLTIDATPTHGNLANPAGVERLAEGDVREVDPEGNVHITKPDGSKVFYLTDGVVWKADNKGRVTEIRSTEGSLTKYEYNAAGALQHIRRVNANIGLEEDLKLDEQGWVRTGRLGNTVFPSERVAIVTQQGAYAYKTANGDVHTQLVDGRREVVTPDKTKTIYSFATDGTVNGVEQTQQFSPNVQITTTLLKGPHGWSLAQQSNLGYPPATPRNIASNNVEISLDGVVRDKSKNQVLINPNSPPAGK